MDSFLLETDAIIERTTGDHAVINLCDDEGMEVFRFPVSWSDEQVLLALRFANLLFDRGLRMGKLLKSQEIRSCLEMH